MSRTQYRHDLTGQTLDYYPEEGVPTAASVTAYTSKTSILFGPDSSLIDADASSAVSSVSEGDRSLTVDDSSDYNRGQRYWLAEDGGAYGQEVEVIGIPDGTTLRLKQPVRNDISSGTVKSHRLSRTLAAADVSTRRRFIRVVWTYTVDGVEHVKDELIDVVYTPFRLTLTEHDVEKYAPEFGDAGGEEWRHHVAAAVDDIWLALEGQGIYPDRVKSRDMLKPALAYRALSNLYARDEALRTHYEMRYRQSWGSFLSSKAWYDQDDDLAVSEGGVVWVDVGGQEVPVEYDDQAGRYRARDEIGLPISGRMRVG